MRILSFLLLLLFLGTSCYTTRDEASELSGLEMETEFQFEKAKWQTQEGKDFPHREELYEEILYSDAVRQLNKEEILDLLGEPSYDRDDTNYLHYLISQKRLVGWPFHTRVLVIKFRENQRVEWIKLHE